MKKQLYIDLAERSLWTFVQAFFAMWMVTQSLDRDTLYVALVAGLAAVGKSLVAGQFGDRDSAATLPESLEPPSEKRFGARKKASP